MSNLISVEKRVGKFLGGRWKASKGEEDHSWIVDYEGVDLYFRIREIEWFTDDWDSIVVVEISSIILFDVPCSDELFEHLARTNGDSLFGAIFATSSSWSEREGFCDLILNHRLMGNHLDPDELNLAIVAIGVVVNEFRKEYHEAFGGIPVNDVDIFGDEDDEGEDES